MSICENWVLPTLPFCCLIDSEMKKCVNDVFVRQKKYFSSEIRIHTADLKFTRICLVNSLYFSFTVDKKLFAYNLSADHQGVFSSEPSSPPLHISTGHHQHSSIEAEIAPQCRSIHAATTPKPTITFKLKHFSTVYLFAHTTQ